jgi:amidase
VKGPDEATTGKMGDDELEALMTEFKAAIDGYLSGAPAAVKTRTLADLIAFNRAEPRETPLFGQELFEQSEAKPPISDPAYLKSRARLRATARGTLDAMLAEGKVEALVAPSGGPPSIVDPVNGSRFFGSFSGLPAVSGYPHLTVPMGDVDGLPVGLSLIGPAWSEARLLAIGYAFEQATHARRTPEFRPSQAVRPEVARAYDPR